MIDLKPLFAPAGIDPFAGLAVIFLAIGVCFVFAILCGVVQARTGTDRYRWSFVIKGAIVVALTMVGPLWGPSTGRRAGTVAAGGALFSLFAFSALLGFLFAGVVWLGKRSVE